MGKPSELKGTLTKVEWDNPHVYWDVNVKDAGGNLAHWSVEGLPPSYLHRSGVNRSDIVTLVGKEVTIHGRLAKDGSKLMFGLDFVRCRHPSSSQSGPRRATIIRRDLRFWGEKPMKRHSCLLGHLVFVAAALFAVSASARSNQNSAPPRAKNALLRSFRAIVPNRLRALPMDIPISPECGLRSTEH